jgi:hypothetical protein
MESDDIKKTAFSTMSGHYEWSSPFWIKISSTYVQKNNSEISWKTFIQGLHQLFRRHSKTIEEHISLLKDIFTRLKTQRETQNVSMLI